MLYAELIERHLSEERVILNDGKKEYTYRELHNQVQLVRGYFVEQGIERGDRVLIWSQNRAETAIIILACIASGVIFVPVSEMYTEEMREEIRTNCRPALEIHADAALDDFAGCRGQLPADRPLLSEETEVYILYTSGTSGRQKGILAKQKQILFVTGAINRRLSNREEDRILCVLPLSFDYGLYQLFLSLRYGAALYLRPPEMLQTLPRRLKEWKITAFPALPSMVNLLAYAGLWEEVALPDLRYMTFTGERLPVSLVSALERQLPGVEIVPMYGLSECKRVSILPFGDSEKRHRGSCGLPLDGVKVWLENMDADGIGELVVSGPNVMEGYWGDEEASARIFRREGEKIKLHTGDLFRMDEEGYLYFCGRKNRLLKIRGYRVGGEWLEQRFLRHPEIAECRACPVMDEMKGESIAIFIYGEAGKVREAVRRERGKLPEYLWTAPVIIRDKPFPRSENYKIDERRLIFEWKGQGDEI